MSNINNVNLTGNLGADVNVQFTKNKGTKVVTFNIANSSTGYKNKEGEFISVIDWIRCVAYGKRAEVIEKNFKKGDKIFVNGRLSARSWETEEGKRTFITEVVVNSFDFGSKALKNQETHIQQNEPQPPVDIDIPTPEDFDEEIPF